MARGYQSYRGRMPGWKKVLIIILLLILVAAGVFLILQPKLVFDENGLHWQALDTKVSQTDDQSADENDVADIPEDFIIDIPEPEPADVLHGVSVESDVALSENGVQLEEGQRPVISVKAANGTFLLSDMTDADAQKIKERNTASKAVARISCFADTKRADSDNSMAVMSVSGRAWRDPNGNAWLDPYDEAARAYLVGIVQKCVALGYTEIVLEDVQFPTYGIVNRVTYGAQVDTAEARVEAINSFLKQVKDAVSEKDVKVSIALPSTLLETKQDAVAGWDLSAIVQSVDRIYMDTASQAEADAARAAVTALRDGADAEVFFVAQAKTPLTGGSYVLMK